MLVSSKESWIPAMLLMILHTSFYTRVHTLLRLARECAKSCVFRSHSRWGFPCPSIPISIRSFRVHGTDFTQTAGRCPYWLAIKSRVAPYLEDRDRVSSRTMPVVYWRAHDLIGLEDAFRGKRAMLGTTFEKPFLMPAEGSAIITSQVMNNPLGS